LATAKELADAPVNVTIVDRHNFHTFQPLLYQVATAGLNAADVAYAVRGIFQRQRNVSFRQAEVVGVDWSRSALLLDDGEPVYDSVAIAEYLDALPGGAKFIPADPRERALVRREEALGDGISDAGILMRLERQRDAARLDPGWIARQHSKVEAGVAAASRMVATHKPGSITLGDIALACALLWVDFRMPEVGWRKDAALKAWIERLESRPSFANTRPG
jgi:glutathione S-transferase